MAPRKSIKCPLSLEELKTRIVHMGGYEDGYKFLLKIFRETYSTSIIISGRPGVGKLTLVREVVEEVGALALYLSTFDCTDDIATLKTIASGLGIKVGNSLEETVTNIEKRTGTTGKKIVIVLESFEEFCRRKQHLLYALSSLTQHGSNFCLVGITMDLYSTYLLEKRVRSRLNGYVYRLKPPYSSKEEYVEFASQLLGGYKIANELKNQLESLYEYDYLSIGFLKQYLISICSLNDDNTLTVNETVDSINRNDDEALTRSLLGLTTLQLDLLKVAVAYCSFIKDCAFNLEKLRDYAHTTNYKDFVTDSPLAIKNTIWLTKRGFFITMKKSDVINQTTQFALGVLKYQFKSVIRNNPDLHHLKTDPFWKKHIV